MTITPEEVAKLAAAATPGPWCNTVQSGEITDAKGYYIGRAMLAGTSVGRANAAFIAAAHDMAALIAELEAQLETALKALDFYSCDDGCNECPEHERDRVSCGWTARAALAAIKETDNG